MALKSKVGDIVLPIAAIRGEGTSDDYLPPEVPGHDFLREHRRTRLHAARGRRE